MASAGSDARMQGVLRERNPLIRPVVVVSGANGFIGAALCTHLALRHEVRALIRAPRDLYAHSKAEAERLVLAAADSARMHTVVLRLPLVYGPHVGGNFASLLDVVAAERRMPLGAIANRRSLAYVGNVCDAIGAAI